MLGVLTKLFASESDVPQVCTGARGTEGVHSEHEAQQSDSNDGGEVSASSAPASPQWMSYYAKIAPKEISRWVNPEDGSGSISYQQLVENLNMVNIPVLPMKTFADRGNSDSRGVKDRTSTANGYVSKRTLPDVSSGTASAQGAQQGMPNSTVEQRHPAEEISFGESVYGSKVLRSASAWGDQGGLDVDEGLRVSAGRFSRGEVHSRQSLESRSHNGTTARHSGMPRRAEEEVTAGGFSSDTASCDLQLDCTSINGQALHVPVAETRTTYIGPVREFTGTLSGLKDGGATRPGPYSQVPPDYVKVVNSEVRVFYDTEKHARGIVQTPQTASSTATSAGGLVAGDVYSNNGTPPRTAVSSHSSTAEAPTCTEGNKSKPVVNQDCPSPPRLFRKPPPIFLAPVMKTGAEKSCLEASVTHSLCKTDDAQSSRTTGEDAQTTRVTYSLGQYIWTAEDATLGTAHKGEPEMDEKVQRICTGAVFPAVFQPETRSEDGRRLTTSELEGYRRPVSPQAPRVKIEDLGMPSILERRRRMISHLQHLSGRISEFVRDDQYAVEAGSNVEATVKGNTGGRGGLRAARCAKKASVVFVERPMLKAEMTLEGLWEVFTGLREDEKRWLTMLDGCAADLSGVEALLCALHCRKVTASERVGAFQDFYGKMKLNAYALSNGEGWALYPHAARIKHSCQPNVSQRSIDGLLVFSALRDIPEGTPITMSYIDQLFMPTQERRKRLIARKRLFCKCSRCMDPRQPERTVLCPQCRPTKLCFSDENTKQHDTNHSSGVATMEKRHGNLLQGEPADAAEDPQEGTADGLSPDTKRTPDKDNKGKCVPLKHARAEKRTLTSSKQRVDNSCVDLAYEGESKDSTDSCSDVSLPSVCSEREREGGRIAVCDKLCIVSTTIMTKRADADAKKETDNVEHRSADTVESQERWMQQEDTPCDVEKEGVSKYSDVASSASCGSEEFSVTPSQLACSDDDSEECASISKSLCTSFLDAMTSADSNGNCSSSDFSEEEQEQSAKEAAAENFAGGKRQISLPEDQRCRSGALVQEGNVTKITHDAHCVFEGDGRWRCGACGREFTDNDMPVALETYLTGYYTALRERLGRPTPEAWNTECGQLIRTVEKVFGVEHWLYMAGHLLLAQLYLGMWTGGHVVDVILTQALRHASLVVSSASKPALSATRSVDIAPLLTAVLRILLFNGRCHDFIEWVEKRGALQVIKETIGTYDEVYTSFSTAYLYVRQKIDGGSEPSLGLLHRFAHASQYTIALDAAYYEKKEAEDKERTARIKAAETEEAEALTRAQTLRERRLQEVKQNVAALKASSPSKKPKQVQDVTFTSPQSVVGQYLRKYAAPGATVANTAAALRQGLRLPPAKDDDLRQTFSNAALTAQAAYEQAKQLQHLAIEGRYPGGLPPPRPENGYLPLIMLADPVERSVQQERVVHQSSEVVEGERKRCVELKQMLHNCTSDKGSAVEDANTTVDLKEHRDTRSACDARTQTKATNGERSFVYKIPGLPGAAPGEFVTISQINHTKDGKYPPIPFFRTFFYVDHDARNMTQCVGENDEPPVSITVLGCGAGGVPALTKEELDELAVARKKFLHVEAERFNKETRNALVFAMGRRAQEAGAALDSLKLVDERRSVPSKGITPLSAVDIFQEVNKAVQDVVIQDAGAVHRIEKFRERRYIESTEDAGNTSTTHRLKENHEEEQRGLSAQRTIDPPVSPDVKDLSLSVAAPASAPLHHVTPPHFSGVKVLPEPRLTRCEMKGVSHHSVKVHPQENFPNSGKDSEQFDSEDGAHRMRTQNQMRKNDLVNTGCARRFLKPLDFSRIPPPPVLPTCARSSVVGLHSQYKHARAMRRTACQHLQMRPPAVLPCSTLTSMRNSVLADHPLPVSPVYYPNSPNEH